MKTITEPKENASALIIALLVVFLIAAAIGIATNMTSNTLKVTDSSRDFSALGSAAEGALDFGYGIWAKTTNNYYGPATKAQLDRRPGHGPAIRWVFLCLNLRRSAQSCPGR